MRSCSLLAHPPAPLRVDSEPAYTPYDTAQALCVCTGKCLVVTATAAALSSQTIHSLEPVRQGFHSKLARTVHARGRKEGSVTFTAQSKLSA